MIIDINFLKEALMEYFNIGDSYAYFLTRVKEAFNYGTVKPDDFEEFTEENIDDIIQFITNKLDEMNRTIDEISGVHEEGLGWNPKGDFYGECDKITCVDCSSNGIDKENEEEFNNINIPRRLKNKKVIKMPKLKDGRIYSSYELGKNIREKIELDNKDKDKNYYIFTFPKNTMSISRSFFRGLFDDSITTLGEIAFKEKYNFMFDDGSEFSDILNFDIHEAIYDLLHY